MREIQASEAQTDIDQLPDDVELGETPITAIPQQEIDDAIEDIMDLRKRNGKITFEELRSAREEGR
jgi:hypothetical protein